MSNENTETVKSVSAGSIVLWLLGPIVNTLTKKYFKINLSGMARFIIAVILIIGGTMISTSVDEALQTTDNQSGGTEVTQQEEIFKEVYTLKGKGNQDSESFNITSKKVRVTATTCCGSSSVGTFSGVSLEKENGGYTGPGLHISTEGPEQGEGQTTYRNLSPGIYFIQVISGVNWEIKVEQVN